MYRKLIVSYTGPNLLAQPTGPNCAVRVLCPLPAGLEAAGLEALPLRLRVRGEARRLHRSQYTRNGL